jgi:hypothetical protein
LEILIFLRKKGMLEHHGGQEVEEKMAEVVDF